MFGDDIIRSQLTHTHKSRVNGLPYTVIQYWPYPFLTPCCTVFGAVRKYEWEALVRNIHRTAGGGVGTRNRKNNWAKVMGKLQINKLRAQILHFARSVCFCATFGASFSHFCFFSPFFLHCFPHLAEVCAHFSFLFTYPSEICCFLQANLYCLVRRSLLAAFCTPSRFLMSSVSLPSPPSTDSTQV